MMMHACGVRWHPCCGHAGFRVREAEDGFGALAEIKTETPDVLISDLDMPAMSGFELLSIVRRCFPAIGVIAMSGAYSGEAVPEGVAADAFYAKGEGSIGLLLGIVNRSVVREGVRRSRAAAPVWIHCFRGSGDGKDAHLMWCQDCLRTFARGVDEMGLGQALCPHCSVELQFSLVAFPGAVENGQAASAEMMTNSFLQQI